MQHINEWRGHSKLFIEFDTKQTAQVASALQEQ